MGKMEFHSIILIALFHFLFCLYFILNILWAYFKEFRISVKFIFRFTIMKFVLGYVRILCKFSMYMVNKNNIFCFYIFKKVITYFYANIYKISLNLIQFWKLNAPIPQVSVGYLWLPTTQIRWHLWIITLASLDNFYYDLVLKIGIEYNCCVVISS